MLAVLGGVVAQGVEVGTIVDAVVVEGAHRRRRRVGGVRIVGVIRIVRGSSDRTRRSTTDGSRRLSPPTSH